MSNKFYNEFDKVYLKIEEFLNTYSKSTILQSYFLNQLESLFYANLINNFFVNLNRETIKGYNLPRGKIGIIKRKYKQLQKDIKLALSLSSKKKKIDDKFYNDFKLRIKKDFPEFQKVIFEIEKEIDIKKAKGYLKKKEKEIKKLGKLDKDFNNLFTTKAFEAFVQREKCIPFRSKELYKLMKVLTKECLPKLSQKVMKILKRDSKEMLDYERKYRYGFENRLYKRWKEPLDLLECLIRVSLESGEEHKFKLAKTTDRTNDYKRAALIRIHARAIHIANEILVLLKAGYADGANARWRSLHELAIISFFLSKENNDISKRYLDYAYVRAYKEAKNYRIHYKKLGYKALDPRIIKKMKKRVDSLDKKYGDDFGNVSKDYYWIPKSILKNRNFTELENHVKVNHLHPFYNLSCDSLHGGSKGFYRLGLMDEWQDKILLAGASNYGLADPLNNTAISLLHVSVSLLTIKPDFKSIVQMQVMNYYVQEIGPKAAEIQKQIEKDEKRYS